MNIKTVLSEQRLIRHSYSQEQDGRQLLCALTALTGDPETRPSTCPVDKAPAWLAHLLPWIDDAGTKEMWLKHMTRLAELEGVWQSWTPEQSAACEQECKIVAVQEVMRHTKNERASKSCQDVVDALRSGDPERMKDAYVTAAEAAEAAYAAAYVTAAYAAAYVTAAAAAEAACAAAYVTAYAAAEAAYAAVAYATGGASARAAADRIIDGILSAIERSAQ